MDKVLYLGDIPARIVRKDIKHIHLRIVPPMLNVCISVPRGMPIETAQALAMSKFDWLTSRLAVLHAQERALAAEAQNEPTSCLLWGRRYPLVYTERMGQAKVEIREETVHFSVGRDTSAEKRNAILERWYCDQLHVALVPLIMKWEQRMSAPIGRISLQRMKTRWGTCNSATRTIRLNIELARKPLEHLEYVLVHEMVHFQHNNHGVGFQQALTALIPDWRLIRRALDTFPRS